MRIYYKNRRFLLLQVSFFNVKYDSVMASDRTAERCAKSMRGRTYAMTAEIAKYSYRLAWAAAALVPAVKESDRESKQTDMFMLAMSSVENGICSEAEAERTAEDFLNLIESYSETEYSQTWIPDCVSDNDITANFWLESESANPACLVMSVILSACKASRFEMGFAIDVAESHSENIIELADRRCLQDCLAYIQGEIR